MNRRHSSAIILLLSSFVAAQNPPQTTVVAPSAAQAAVPALPTTTSSLTDAQRKAHYADVAKKVEELLSQPDAARGFWGIQIISLANGQTVYENNADKLFLPASNTKLFTTITALATLGPDFRRTTSVETAGTLDRSGKLHGDLLLVGRGDPNLSGRVLPYNKKTERTTPALKLLEELADQLVQKGVKSIDGDVIGDDTYFAFERFGDGWSQDDLLWDYGAPVSALTINDNVVFMKMAPGTTIGDKAKIEFEPDVAYYEVDNRITTAAAGGKRNVSIDRQPGSRVLTVWGTIPLDDPGTNEALAIDDPADYAAKAFRAMLEKRGIAIKGKDHSGHLLLASLPPLAPESAVRVAQIAPSPKPGGGPETSDDAQKSATPARLVLASHQSQPLADDVRVTVKVSQNLHAELAFRQLGAIKGAQPTVEASLAVMKGFLTEIGIAPEEYTFSDGSGLSRQDMVTPRAVVKLLQFADFPSAWRAAFQDALPVAGEDGSLAERMKGTFAQDHVWAKTGSLGHVNALSGYAQTLSGDRLAFSIIVNNHKLGGRGATKIMDQILETVVNDTGAVATEKKP
jgi:D-alanyl-D-alanine carboxypeptidase/D-alanyl-D-alanine-endopeptidase (penicillin-binding protein 4)